MIYKIDDEFYQKIEQKVNDGIFTRGKKQRLSRYYFEDKTINDFSIEERTPEVCISLMSYCNCELSDVPTTSRTREFYLNAFPNNDVYDYIKNNIEDFDRQFFKDLLATNEWATHFSNNCFEIMPLEYIDEEMCSLAILVSTDWTSDGWFYSVYKRKPEALIADLWKLGARLYSRMSGEENRFLDITPEEYQDVEYYKEMCKCNFNYGMCLPDNKGKIMETVPSRMLTESFLLDLLKEDIKSVAIFSEEALEKKIKCLEDGVEVTAKIWQICIRVSGDVIKYIALNDERVEFFLRHYDEYSIEYDLFFKEKYKRYKKDKEKLLAKVKESTSKNEQSRVDTVENDDFFENSNNSWVEVVDNNKKTLVKTNKKKLN